MTIFIFIVIFSQITRTLTVSEEHKTPLDNSVVSESFSSIEENNMLNDHLVRFEDWYENNDFEGGSSLINYLEALKNNRVSYSRSLIELLQTTPESVRENVQINLLISFDSPHDMISQELNRYNPELMNSLPIAIVKTSLKAVNDISSIPGIKGVFIDEYIPFFEVSRNNNDITTYPSESVIGARYLQDLGINGSGVKIAILDTGIEKTHPDLDDIDNNDSTYDPKVILEASFIDFDEDGINDTSARDDHFHGTHVAGIAAGNGFLKGIAPAANLMNGKVLDKTIGGYTSWIVKGIDWAVSNGADIISMSLGGLPGDTDPLFEAAISSAWEHGTIVVASAGNEGPEPSSISSPGLESRTITVGASNVYNEVAFFSSRGPSPTGIVDPDLVAPGRGILSLDLGGGYTIASGTSMSAPAVAGVVALLLSAKPDASPDEIRSALLSTASDMGRHVFVQGAGLVNATAAYERLQNPSVFAFPSFSPSYPLILSPGEFFEYQLDVFLNESFTLLNITASSQLKSYVDLIIVDQPDRKGWVRAKVQVSMPIFAINGNLMIKNGTKTYFVAGLSLQPDTPANDAESETDAGETFAGALPITMGIPILGEIIKWDRDIYSFSVIKDRVYSVELYNLTGNLDIYITNENGTVFNRSSNQGLLPEEIMFRAESSGDYFIRIEDKTPGTYVLLIRETDEQELSLFPPAYLTGKIMSNPSDHDSDDLFDELKILVEANVSQPGVYNFWYSIAQNRSDYCFGRYVFMWDWLNLTLEEGIQNLTISIPGGLLESSQYTGSYVLNDLAFGKKEFAVLLYYELEVFTTPSYDYTAFTPFNNRLNSFSLEEEDIDKNGVPEKLIVELEFEFSSTGAFIVAVPIFNENHNEVLAFNNETFGVTERGSISITIEFVTQQFKNKGDIIVFGIAGSWFRYLIPIYNRITRENLSSFEPIIEYTISDKPIDTNDNGKDDAIRFSFIIVSKVETEAVLFTGHPYSYPNETMVLVNTSNEITINQGTNTVWIDLDAKILSVNDLLGPYFFPNLGLTVRNYEFTQYSPYVTEEYSSSTFDLPLVWFSSFLGGSKFETTSNAGIEVTWEITSTDQFETLFEFDIRDYEHIQGSFSKTLNFTKQITPGVSTISFQIKAEELYNSNYIGNLEIYTAAIYFLDQYKGLEHRYQEHNLTLIDFEFHAGVLPSVHYGEYRGYVDAFFATSPEITLMSTGLSINLTLGVNNAGTYDLGIDLFSENDYTTENISDTTQIIASSIGNYSCSFFFSAEKIVRNAIDDSVYGNASITNIESLNKSEVKIPHFAINTSAFNYTLPIILESITSDYPLDYDQDGKYDAIAAEIMIDVIEGDSYEFSVSIYGQLYNYYETYLGNVTVPNEPLSPGLHKITFVIPYYYLLKLSQEAEELEILPKIEIFVVPLYSIDTEGIFVVSTHPSFLIKQYDLQEFFMIQPLSIGYLQVLQGDSNEDGITDQIEVYIAIVVSSILNYNLEVSLEVFWSNNTQSMEKVVSNSPSAIGTVLNTINFAFSEIFPSDIPPSQFSVKASISVETFDEIQIDKYTTPVNVWFQTGATSSATTVKPTIPTTTESKKSPDIEVFYILITLLITGLFLRKRKKGVESSSVDQ